MSRVVFVSAPEAHVLQTCAKHNIATSAIEVLPSGGTRVVLRNLADAERIAGLYGSQVLAMNTPRTPNKLHP